MKSRRRFDEGNLDFEQGHQTRSTALQNREYRTGEDRAHIFFYSTVVQEWLTVNHSTTPTIFRIARLDDKDRDKPLHHHPIHHGYSVSFHIGVICCNCTMFT